MSGIDLVNRTKANTLSVQLLNTIGGTGEGVGHKKVISNMKNLS